MSRENGRASASRGEKKSAALQTETRSLLQLSRHFTGLWAPLSDHRPSQQPSTLWHAYIYEVLTQLLFVVADSSANRKTHAQAHTHAHQTLTCAAETNHHGNGGVSSDPGKFHKSVHVIGTRRGKRHGRGVGLGFLCVSRELP